MAILAIPHESMINKGKKKKDISEKRLIRNGKVNSFLIKYYVFSEFVVVVESLQFNVKLHSAISMNNAILS